MDNEPIVKNVAKKGQLRLFVDQYGMHIFASTVVELQEKAGGGSVHKQYVDKKDGRIVHIGYVIGDRWFTAYLPWEIEQCQ